MVMVDDPHALNIYTDGSCLSNPRRGGIGIRIILPDELDSAESIRDFPYSGFKGATNNQMELKACIMALEEAMKLYEIRMIDRIVIHTDSLYVYENYPRALFTWSKNGWFKSGGAHVANTDLWKELLRQIKRTQKRVDIEWVKGHSKNEHNKAADSLARQSAKNAVHRLDGVVEVRRKQSKKSVELGSVSMCGQKMGIRIITSTYSKTHKTYRYKYEVVSEKSRYYQNIDVINTDIPLKVGHSYLVSVNRSQKNPKISKVFNEIIKE